MASAEILPKACHPGNKFKSCLNGVSDDSSTSTLASEMPNELIDLVVDNLVNDDGHLSCPLAGHLGPIDRCPEDYNTPTTRLRNLSLVSPTWRKKMVPFIYSCVVFKFNPLDEAGCAQQLDIVAHNHGYKKFVKTVIFHDFGHHNLSDKLAYLFDTIVVQAPSTLSSLVFIDCAITISTTRHFEDISQVRKVALINCAITTEGLRRLSGRLQAGGELVLDDIFILPAQYVGPMLAGSMLQPVTLVMRNLSAIVTRANSFESFLGSWRVDSLKVQLCQPDCLASEVAGAMASTIRSFTYECHDSFTPPFCLDDLTQVRELCLALPSSALGGLFDWILSVENSCVADITINFASFEGTHETDFAVWTGIVRALQPACFPKLTSVRLRWCVDPTIEAWAKSRIPALSTSLERDVADCVVDVFTDNSRSFCPRRWLY
ncbi:hypothetical protein CYLTODRAFT_443218 [Cylindrobasidium torrendii FP15055 ss-10]|uniref:Uncharacterized protein n=1 Tax=Cylindrobasidium torrendii FP15055 ss-10 TaxID=1314674 RepID=A0A0D7BDJ5_9AGAR|nr:hypothetical protein CYLTODRAFT_443218 [Cylindrobasidium torrendii FP15055 ss-10]